ncbi:hypothetical protein [Cryptosporangium phraense]|nr:hypothetical protein [Cryptosporangium phraense]
MAANSTTTHLHPAYVHGRHLDALAANPMARARSRSAEALAHLATVAV